MVWPVRFVTLLLQKLYIVCDVALFVIANKSTACHLECPKEPILPTKFFLTQDKVIYVLLFLFELCKFVLFLLLITYFFKSGL